MSEQRRARGLKEQAKCPPNCFYADQDGYCSFLHRARQRRGCDPGPDCDKYLPADGPREKQINLPTEYWPRDPRRPSAVQSLQHDETALRLYAAGASDPEIAEATGWSVSSVRRWRRETGRPPTRNFGSIEDRKEDAERLYNKGASDVAIAAELGVTHCGVRMWRLRTGRKPNFPKGRSYTDKK